MSNSPNVRAFLLRALPWGTGNISVEIQTQYPDRASRMGYPVKDVDQLLDKVTWYSKKPDNRGVWFWVASGREVENAINKAGKPYTKAIRNTENAVALKSFFIDLDVKDDAYASPQEAVAALKQFLLATNLPEPTAYVASGNGGFHVYFIMRDAIPVEEWLPLARSLVKAINHHGLKTDAGYTTNAASANRAPGSLNHKSGTGKPVALKVLRDDDIPNEVWVEALEPYRQLVVDDPLFSRSDQLLELEPKDIDEVAQLCPWVWHSLETGGVDNTHYLRLDAYLLAAHCKDTDEVAWDMVGLRSTLSEEEFATKLEETKTYRVEKALGYPRCETIAGHGAAQCVACPYRAQGLSPLSIKPLQPAAPVTGTALSTDTSGGWIPEGFFQDANHLIHYREDGLTEIAFPYPIKDPWMTFAKPCMINFYTKVGEQDRHIQIPASSTVSKEKLRTALCDAGGMSFDAKPKTMEFFVTFLAKLQGSRATVMALNPYGWNYEQGIFTGFTYDGKVYTKEGSKAAPDAAPGLKDQYSAKGSQAVWIEAAKLITEQKRPALDAIIATSFGAPLVHLMGGSVEGVTIGAISNESGIGKSTALKIAQAIWADPYISIGGLSDTLNSTFGRMGAIKHLPYFFDEIKSMEQSRSFVEIIFQLSSGREKSRMTQSAELREQKTWQTALVYASNESMYDAVLKRTGTTTAGHMRLFEYTVPPIPDGGRLPMLNAIVGKLKQNHGVIGQLYAEKLGADYAVLQPFATGMYEYWEKLLKAKEEHRFWVAACACIMGGAQLANDYGFATFDLDGLEEFLCAEFARMSKISRHATNDLSNVENVVNIFGDFLSGQSARNTIRTNIVWAKPYAPTGVTIIGDGTSAMNKLDEINVQIGVEDKVIAFSDMALSKWCELNHMNKSSLTGAFERFFYATAKAQKLGSGTSKVQAQRRVWRIDASDLPEFQDFFSCEEQVKDAAQ